MIISMDTMMIFCKCLSHSVWQHEEKLLVLDPLNPQHVAKVGSGNTHVLLEVCVCLVMLQEGL